MQFIERKSGKAVDIPDDQAQAAFQSGEYGLPRGASIPVIAPNGQVGMVGGEDAGRALDDGLAFASPQQVVESKHAGWNEGIAAGGLGVLRGLTVGLSDPIITAIGGEKARTYLAEEKEAHPYASSVGEVAGAVLPAIASDGGTAAVTAGEMGAEGANLARAGVEAASAAREASAGGRALEAARTATSIVGAPSRAITEIGGLAERAAARIVGDGATGTVARLAQKAIAKGAEQAAEGIFFGLGNQISEDTLGNHELSAEKLLAAMGHGAIIGAATGGAFGAAGEIGSTLARKAKVDELAAEQAWKAIGGASKKAATLAERVGGKAAVGRAVLDEGLLQFGDTLEELAPRIAERRAAVGAKVGEMLGELDALGSEVAPSATRIVDRVAREVIAPLDKLPGMDAQLAAVGRYMQDFARVTGVTSFEKEASVGFKQLASFREVLAGRPELAPVARIVDEELARAGEAAAKARGGDFLRTYKDLGKRYERLTVADTAAQEGLAHAADASAQEMPRAAGHAMLGLALGHPAAAVTAPAMGLVRQAVRERSAASLAVVLDKLSGIAGLRRATAQVDAKIGDALDGFFASKKAPARFRRFKSTSEEYDANAEAVRDAAANPQVGASRTSAVAGALEQHAPKTAASFATTTARATNYLLQALPKTPPAPTVQPQFAKVEPTDFEKSKFNRLARTVHDPTTALEDLARGTMTPDQAKALRTVYPQTYAQIQKAVMSRLADADKPLPYAKRIQLGVLLGIPSDPTLAPTFVKAMQAGFAEKPKKPPAQPQAASSAAPRRSLQHASTTSALMTDEVK